MDSFLSMFVSVPGWLMSFLASHWELVVGYILCVLFPIPWLNSWIISLWAKLLTSEPKIASDVGTVVTTIETTITPASNVTIS
jgi:hypothetical protein